MIKEQSHIQIAVQLIILAPALEPGIHLVVIDDAASGDVLASTTHLLADLVIKLEELAKPRISRIGSLHITASWSRAAGAGPG